tara:strand:- start:2398 stop:3084 length:687 start_codon:yes stop_codon:yes gene_type:complete
MNRLSLFTLLVLVYLGLSKSFSPSERSTPYLVNEQVFSSFFQGAPLSVILTDRLQTGFLIKTYFLELRLVQGFKLPETMLVRTSKGFWEKNKTNLGMSLFRRDEKDGTSSVTPQPPGAIFLGDPSYGNWELAPSGEREWHFYNAYKYFPDYLGWGDYRPTETFTKELKLHLANSETYYGDQKQFGTTGTVTAKVFTAREYKMIDTDVDFKSHMKKFFKLKTGSSEGAP